MAVDSVEHLDFKVSTQPVVAGRPWPRYFARMLDVLLISSVVMFVFGIAFALANPVAAERFFTLAESVGGNLLFGMAAHAIAVVPIALLLAFGQTPGKWLLGIRVRRGDGARMSLSVALKREVLVWTRGLALAIPLISLYTLVMNYGELKNDGTTPWDKSLGLDVSHERTTAWWWIRATLGAAIIIGSSLWGVASYAMSAMSAA